MNEFYEDEDSVSLPAKRTEFPTGVARKPHVLFDEERQNLYLAELAKTGLKSHSAYTAGVAPTTVNRLIKESEEFATLVSDALSYHGESVEREAERRAVDGWLEPVFSQKTGEQIGVVRKYSDRLLEVLVKANNREKFRENVQHDHSVSGGVLVVHQPAKTDAEWEDQYGGSVSGPGGKLGAPESPQ